MKKTTPYPDITLEFYGDEANWGKKHTDGRWYRYYANGEPVLFSPSKIAGCLDKPQLKFWQLNCMAEELLEKIKTGAGLTEQDIIAAKSASDRAKDKAALRGTAVHAYAEAFVKGDQPALPEDDRTRNGVLAFLRWWNEEHKIEPIETEKHLYSKEYGIAGMTDLVARVDGKLAIVDYKAAGAKDAKSVCCEDWAGKNETDYFCKKCGGTCDITTNGVYSSYHYQTALYAMMWDEMSPKQKTETRWVIRFDTITGKPESYELSDSEKDKEAALSLLAALKREEELK